MHTLVPLAINTTGITSLIIQKILPVILVIIGAGIIAASKKRKMSDLTTQIAIIVVGCILIGGAGLFAAFGDDLAHTIFSNGAPAKAPAAKP